MSTLFFDVAGNVLAQDIEVYAQLMDLINNKHSR
jgi:hypothetical protein